MPQASATAANPTDSFRPDIEGMRGVAVLLVVLFHSKVPGFRGGFIGVDVFFALSGYLITGLILKELERTGRLSFRKFYARRVRRLLPASGLVVVSTLLLALLVYSPLEIARYAQWATYTSLYVSNFMFMRDASNYFASDSALNPYLHTWSLAVEEQFYLFWPALITTSFLLLRSRRKLGLVLLVICTGSLAMCVWLTRVHQPWAFFSLPTRAWEFALGGLACLFSKQRLVPYTRMLSLLGWIGLASVVASGCVLSERNFPGSSAILPVTGTVISLVAGAVGGLSLQRFLGTKTLQYFGRLSYSWYLWHWPILLFTEACIPSITWAGRLLAAAIALGLAQITFWTIEKPVRFSRFLVARPAFSLSLALVIAVLGTSTAASVFRKANSELLSRNQERYWAAAHEPRVLFDANCLVPAGAARLRECSYGDPAGKHTAVLFGDSHAEHWFAAVDAIAKVKHWRLITLLKSSCPVSRVSVYNVTLKREDTECNVWREKALNRVVELNPILAILSQKDAVVRKRNQESGGISPDAWQTGLHSTLSYLSDHRVKTLYIEDVPRADVDVPTCLSRMESHAWSAKDCTTAKTIALNSEARIAETEAIQGVAGAQLVDFTNQFCVGSLCQPMVFGQVAYRDTNHLSSVVARGLAPLLQEQIDSLLQQRPATNTGPEPKIVNLGTGDVAATSDF